MRHPTLHYHGSYSYTVGYNVHMTHKLNPMDYIAQAYFSKKYIVWVTPTVHIIGTEREREREREREMELTVTGASEATIGDVVIDNKLFIISPVKPTDLNQIWVP